jgi:hypothetical protein
MLALRGRKGEAHTGESQRAVLPRSAQSESKKTRTGRAMPAMPIPLATSQTSGTVVPAGCQRKPPIQPAIETLSWAEHGLLTAKSRNSTHAPALTPRDHNPRVGIRVLLRHSAFSVSTADTVATAGYDGHDDDGQPSARKVMPLRLTIAPGPAFAKMSPERSLPPTLTLDRRRLRFQGALRPILRRRRATGRSASDDMRPCASARWSSSP